MTALQYSELASALVLGLVGAYLYYVMRRDQLKSTQPPQRLIEKLRERLHVLWYGRNTHCAMCDIYGCETDEEFADAEVAHVREHPHSRRVVPIQQSE